MSLERNGGMEPVKLDDLYQEVILDHNRRPRNFKKLENATGYAHGINPLCGDDYHVYLNVGVDGRVEDIGFQGSGCAISKSSASMMTTLVQGKSAKEAGRLKQDFLDLMTRDRVDERTRTAVGRLGIFEGVRNYPIRVKCATLIWRALEAALKGENKAVEVSTE